MGLYINDREHPEVYKNNGQIAPSNQAYSRQDFLTELMKEQQEANLALRKALDELKMSQRHQETVQTEHLEKIGSELIELKQRNHHHEQLEGQMLQWLKTLDEKQQELIENELLHKNEMFKRIDELHNTNQTIAGRMEQHENTAKSLTVQIAEQLELQKQAAARQKEFQAEVVERLDKQEALTEKMIRQLTNIRSILFERSTHLATKIEEGYQLTSSYVYKLMTGSEQPLTFFLYNQKKEENQHKPD